MSNIENKRKIWQFPWAYRESFIFAAGLMIVGFMLEYFAGGSIVRLPSYPINLFILLVFIAYLVGTHFLVKGPVMTWLSSVPAAMASMTMFTVLILLMGFIPQVEPKGFIGKIGLHHIHSSRPYIIIAVFMLTVLGYTIIKRLRQKFTLKNVAFLLNHAGLFIILTTASVGSSDMMRLKMPLMEGETSTYAFPDEHHRAEMPFSVTLHSFTIEEYPPEMLIFNAANGAPELKKGDHFPFVEEGNAGNIQEYTYEILSVISYAVPMGEGYVFTEDYGSTHAALVRISKGSFQTEDWISSGNFMYPPKYLMLDSGLMLGMLEPRVKRYVSVVDITENDQLTRKNAEISVNQPLKIGQWKMYQYSYSDQLGRWSQMSVFELIRDPWLPAVYTGIFMVLLGTLYLLWTGRKIEKVNEEKLNPEP